MEDLHRAPGADLIGGAADDGANASDEVGVFEQPRGVDESVYAEGRQQGGGEPRAVTIGDVTGDGKNDLVLLVHDRIIIYPQD